MTTIKNYCISCKKQTKHKKVYLISKGRYNKRDKGKKYHAGYKCLECGCKWDNL